MRKELLQELQKSFGEYIQSIHGIPLKKSRGISRADDESAYIQDQIHARENNCFIFLEQFLTQQFQDALSECRIVKADEKKIKIEALLSTGVPVDHVLPTRLTLPVKICITIAKHEIELANYNVAFLFHYDGRVELESIQPTDVDLISLVLDKKNGALYDYLYKKLLDFYKVLPVKEAKEKEAIKGSISIFLTTLAKKFGIVLEKKLLRKDGSRTEVPSARSRASLFSIESTAESVHGRVRDASFTTVSAASAIREDDPRTEASFARRSRASLSSTDDTAPLAYAGTRNNSVVSVVSVREDDPRTEAPVDLTAEPMQDDTSSASSAETVVAVSQQIQYTSEAIKTEVRSARVPSAVVVEEKQRAPGLLKRAFFAAKNKFKKPQQPDFRCLKEEMLAQNAEVVIIEGGDLTGFHFGKLFPSKKLCFKNCILKNTSFTGAKFHGGISFEENTVIERCDFTGATAASWFVDESVRYDYDRKTLRPCLGVVGLKEVSYRFKQDEAGYAGVVIKKDLINFSFETADDLTFSSVSSAAELYKAFSTAYLEARGEYRPWRTNIVKKLDAKKGLTDVEKLLFLFEHQKYSKKSRTAGVLRKVIEAEKTKAAEAKAAEAKAAEAKAAEAKAAEAKAAEAKAVAEAKEMLKAEEAAASAELKAVEKTERKAMEALAETTKEKMRIAQDEVAERAALSGLQKEHVMMARLLESGGSELKKQLFSVVKVFSEGTLNTRTLMHFIQLANNTLLTSCLILSAEERRALSVFFWDTQDALRAQVSCALKAVIDASVLIDDTASVFSSRSLSDYQTDQLTRIENLKSLTKSVQEEMESFYGQLKAMFFQVNEQLFDNSLCFGISDLDIVQFRVAYMDRLIFNLETVACTGKLRELTELREVYNDSAMTLNAQREREVAFHQREREVACQQREREVAFQQLENEICLSLKTDLQRGLIRLEMELLELKRLESSFFFDISRVDEAIRFWIEANRNNLPALKEVSSGSQQVLLCSIDEDLWSSIELAREYAEKEKIAEEQKKKAALAKADRKSSTSLEGLSSSNSSIVSVPRFFGKVLTPEDDVGECHFKIRKAVLDRMSSVFDGLLYEDEKLHSKKLHSKKLHSIFPSTVKKSAVVEMKRFFNELKNFYEICWDFSAGRASTKQKLLLQAASIERSIDSLLKTKATKDNTFKARLLTLKVAVSGYESMLAQYKDDLAQYKDDDELQPPVIATKRR
ncbi:MAG: hypothetical protein COX72_02235 [Gammaproteobacteria bacterium CG_4_10_14_0_2_um_filter_38_22]|nr:MAG: hypothetical protein COX72_02235 [Gammaproteobacteria bacterium CG_4_10_14_0_2_um_filter_38_22]